MESEVNSTSELSSQSPLASETLSNTMSTPNRSAVADALERRLHQQRAEAAASNAVYTAFDEHHEKRQQFRRMIDPGILRHNPRRIALEAIDILLKLAENIIDHPDEEKYMRFKPTNHKIKQYIVDPKGTLEYAIEMGFRPEVENFQPYYAFNKRRMTDLKIGAAILKETFQLEHAREEASALAKQREKAIADAAIAKVKQAFLDDRKSKTLQDRREREARAARCSSVEASTPSPPTSPSVIRSREMPGAGHTLGGVPPPPAYGSLKHEDHNED